MTYLIKTIQENSHKDADWGQKDNTWTKQEFQQRDKNIKKYKIETIEQKNIMTELKNPLKWFKHWLSDQMKERMHPIREKKKNENRKIA